MPLVAFTTFAILRAPPGEAQVQGFFDRLPDNFGAADRFEGFVARSMRDPATLSPFHYTHPLTARDSREQT